MSRIDVSLYLVTDPVLAGNSDLTELVVEAVRGGVTCVQVRDKAASDDQLGSTAERLRAALAPYGVPLLVNDRLAAVARADAAGVHLGVTDVRPLDARQVLGQEAVIGWSIEDLAQLRSPQIAACTYVAVSPVWATPTKTDTTEPLGLSGVSAVRSMTDLPLVGIGGIDAGNAGAVIRAGADGVAVVSAICAAGDPQAAARGIRSAVEAARAERGSLR